MISYEEYRELVVKGFKYYWEDLSDEEVEVYFEREGNKITRESYESERRYPMREGNCMQRAVKCLPR